MKNVCTSCPRRVTSACTQTRRGSRTEPGASKPPTCHRRRPTCWRISKAAATAGRAGRVSCVTSETANPVTTRWLHANPFVRAAGWNYQSVDDAITATERVLDDPSPLTTPAVPARNARRPARTRRATPRPASHRGPGRRGSGGVIECGHRLRPCSTVCSLRARGRPVVAQGMTPPPDRGRNAFAVHSLVVRFKSIRWTEWSEDPSAATASASPMSRR